jgi:hypothetical protein
MMVYALLNVCRGCFSEALYDVECYPILPLLPLLKGEGNKSTEEYFWSMHCHCGGTVIGIPCLPRSPWTTNNIEFVVYVTIKQAELHSAWQTKGVGLT